MGTVGFDWHVVTYSGICFDDNLYCRTCGELRCYSDDYLYCRTYGELLLSISLCHYIYLDLLHAACVVSPGVSLCWVIIIIIAICLGDSYAIPFVFQLVLILAFCLR